MVSHLSLMGPFGFTASREFLTNSQLDLWHLEGSVNLNSACEQHRFGFSLLLWSFFLGTAWAGVRRFSFSFSSKTALCVSGLFACGSLPTSFPCTDLRPFL